MKLPADLPSQFPIPAKSSSEGEYKLKGNGWVITAAMHQYRVFYQGALVAYVDEKLNSDARTNAQRANYDLAGCNQIEWIAAGDRRDCAVEAVRSPVSGQHLQISLPA